MTVPGGCAACLSTSRVLTREHIPPQSTGNRGGHRVELLTLKSEARSVLVDADDGVALSVLCEHCNSRLGSRLGTSFAAFAGAIAQSGRFASPGGGVFVSALDVFPARIIRHLLLNYLCIQQDVTDSRWDALRDFIRSREPGAPSDAPSVSLYYNRSNNYRLVPVGGVGSIRASAGGPWHGAEISAPGLGAIFTLGDPTEVEPHILPRTHDVTDWGRLPFDHRERIILDLPAYWVETPHPLGFGRRKEVDRWQSDHFIVWLATPMVTDLAGDAAAMLWRPRRRKA